MVYIYMEFLYFIFYWLFRVFVGDEINHYKGLYRPGYVYIYMVYREYNYYLGFFTGCLGYLLGMKSYPVIL